MEEYLKKGEEFLDFVNNSCSPFHAVQSTSEILLNNGFVKISENDDFTTLKPTGKYFYTRNQSSICAFEIGGQFKKGNGITVVAAHTDSPNLKIRPISTVKSEGYIQVGVETYGGGLWHTWFDRDLTIAGRVLIENGDKTESKLVKVDRPILRIPSLAIHLTSAEDRAAFKFDKQDHLLPVLATSIAKELSGNNEVFEGDAQSTFQQAKHDSLLLGLLASELNVKVEQIQNFEISVCDATASVIGGIEKEFIFSARLDNLLMSFCALKALVGSDDNLLSKQEDVRVMVLFDDEEVGSESAYGAGSPIVNELVAKLNGGNELHSLTTKRNSFIISADMAHAVHPNYPSKHESNQKPMMHKGVTIKYNANQRYSTTAETAYALLKLARKHNIPIQEISMKNNVPCGSTIGPILSTSTGIRTVDVGNPQLSMHSIREMCSVSDITHAINLFTVFYQEYSSLNIVID